MSDKTTIHPHTLDYLKTQLPTLQSLAKVATEIVAPNSKHIKAAVQELRDLFPGLDDLTLAAFAAYRAETDLSCGDVGAALDSTVVVMELAKELL